MAYFCGYFLSILILICFAWERLTKCNLILSAILLFFISLFLLNHQRVGYEFLSFYLILMFFFNINYNKTSEEVFSQHFLLGFSLFMLILTSVSSAVLIFHYNVDAHTILYLPFFEAIQDFLSGSNSNCMGNTETVSSAKTQTIFEGKNYAEFSGKTTFALAMGAGYIGFADGMLGFSKFVFPKVGPTGLLLTKGLVGSKYVIGILSGVYVLGKGAQFVLENVNVNTEASTIGHQPLSWMKNTGHPPILQQKIDVLTTSQEVNHVPVAIQQAPLDQPSFKIGTVTTTPGGILGRYYSAGKTAEIKESESAD